MSNIILAYIVRYYFKVIAFFTMIQSENNDFSTKESQVTDISEKLNGYTILVDDVRAGKKDISALKPIINEIEGWINEGALNLFDRLLSYFVLSHSYGTIRYITKSPEKAYYNEKLAWKEVYCYRSTLNLINEVHKRGIFSLYYTATEMHYQSLIHLANVYDHFGRFQEAQSLWRQAGRLKPNDYMWQFNIGFSLANTHAYYEKRAEPFVLSYAKALLLPCLEKPETMVSATVAYARIKDLETPEISMDKEVKFANSEEGRYNQWVNYNRLRLNAFNDITPRSILSQEDSLYFKGILSFKDNLDFGPRMFSLLNEIKQEFVSARYMLYQYIINSGTIHFSDKKVFLADNSDGTNYSYNIEMAKSSFRALYSLLDKIAYSINEYLSLGIKGSRVAFKDFWYLDKQKHTLKPEITRWDSNYSLAGLLFIRNDIYGGDEHYLQDEKTIRLKAVRNAMEHRSMIITEDGEFDDRGLVLKISRMDFEETAMSLIQTVRQAIFCLVNMVNHIEYDKKESTKILKQIVISKEIPVVSDEGKV